MKKTIEGIVFEMEPMESKNISYLGHDAESGVLVLEFIRGPVYVFYEVPPEVFEQLRTTEEPDAFFDTQIKNGYRNKRIA